MQKTTTTLHTSLSKAPLTNGNSKSASSNDESNNQNRDSSKALDFHSVGKPGKLEMRAIKPVETLADLSLAYSPGVAEPVIEISNDPSKAFDYTNKGNMVAVVSNGTAILGLGNLGALASKPVMEGKAILFKRFADIDSVDLEIDTSDPQKFIDCVRYLGPAFGGINLEDIKAPDSMIIEEALDGYLDIPVFHDDQHGTAIVIAAALINALKHVGKTLKTVNLVVAGSGSAALASVNLLIDMGLPRSKITMCDEHGALTTNRADITDKWRKPHLRNIAPQSLSDAFQNADIAIGLSAEGVFTKAMIKSMATNPIIFAMANPNPEIFPEDIQAVRQDAIIATGRSDYPNQVNNVLSFPHIFRGALDVRATTINLEMKLACVIALAEIIHSPSIEGVEELYSQSNIQTERLILPHPFDPRLRTHIAPFVANAAMHTGVALKPIESFEEYKRTLSSRFES